MKLVTFLAAGKCPKRQVTVNTFLKWQSSLEREHQTISWLRYDVDKMNRTLVDTLWCEACRKNEERIIGMKNYSGVWIKGSTNHKTSSVVDHAKSDQHKAAMIHVRKASNQPIKTYSPIARSLLTMDETTQKRMERKFDICYVMAKESMAFKKYPSLYSLELRHGVNLGQAYKTKDSAKYFTHYIAESQRQNFISFLSATSRFYSFLMDGSTDSGKVEDEVVVIMYCTQDAVSEKVKSCARYFSIEVPKKADADGLVECLGRSLEKLGITDLMDKAAVLGVQTKPILIGGGTDGASVNISDQNGMRGKIQRELPWILWAWCYAHRLELACKDALSSPLFQEIEEMLLRLYYLYSKSPKKCRELTDIVEDLEEVFEFPKGGNLPVRSQGSRWINHKRAALQRFVDRFGAYLNHLLALIEDKSLKSDDRARLKGYTQKWKQPRMLVGAALYIDILKSPSILSLSLQDDSLDIVAGIKSILKSSKSLKQMAQDPLDEWPTLKLIKTRIKLEEGNNHVYQGVSLQGYSASLLQQCATQALADLKRLDSAMRNRLEWSDVEMLRSILVFLDTQSWCKSGDSESDELEEINAAVEYITTHFREPLEAVSMNISSIRDEIEEIVDYARKYLSIRTESYQTIWYKLHVAPDVSKWPNVLVLCELLFSLPFSNGRVERIFSSMKVIKTDRRTNLLTETLSDLMEIQVEGPALLDFSASSAVQLWWEDCCTTRRVNQAPRKPYKPRASETESSSASPVPSTSAESEGTLSDWDSWFHPLPSDSESD